MPGDNCCIPLCGSCQQTKGLGIFKLPSIKKKHGQEWRKKWLDEILITRVMDSDFILQLEADCVFTCEKHFHPHEIEICKFLFLYLLFFLLSNSIFWFQPGECCELKNSSKCTLPYLFITCNE